MTENRLHILTASGTGALESAVVNTLSPGDRVLAITIGYFGNRFIDMARAYGADVKALEVEWGTAADPDAVRKALAEDPEIVAVMVTHNETSTGVTNDLESISKVVKGEFGKLLLVDAVSSMGCVPLPTDEWRCDLVCTASQKGMMVPPGLAFVSISEDGWAARERARMPRFYFDLEEAKRTLERGQTPFTPNVAAMYGLSLALDKLLAEGLEGVFGRHASIGQLTRSRIREMGLELLVEDERYASNAVTAVKIPEEVDGRALMARLRTERNVVLAGGQGKLSNSIFRIGHLGHVSTEDIDEVMDALEAVLPEVGFRG
jgi:aspartate aminotransferase-like enzyme